MLNFNRNKWFKSWNSIYVIDPDFFKNLGLDLEFTTPPSANLRALAETLNSNQDRGQKEFQQLSGADLRVGVYPPPRIFQAGWGHSPPP